MKMKMKEESTKKIIKQSNLKIEKRLEWNPKLHFELKS